MTKYKEYLENIIHRIPVVGVNGITTNWPVGICITIPPDVPNSFSSPDNENGLTILGGVGGKGKSKTPDASSVCSLALYCFGYIDFICLTSSVE